MGIAASILGACIGMGRFDLQEDDRGDVNQLKKNYTYI